MKRAAFYFCGLLTGLALAFAIPKGKAHDADVLASSAPQRNPLFINMDGFALRACDAEAGAPGCRFS